MPAGIDPDEFLTRLRQAREDVRERSSPSNLTRLTGRLLSRLEASLSKPLRINVLGETNSGKTTLSNRLLGSNLLTTDVIRNTRIPVLVKYSRQPLLQLRHANGGLRSVDAATLEGLDLSQHVAVEVGIPLEYLLRFEILDTPGPVEVVPKRVRWPAAGRPTVPAIWCTIATQAWRASEVEHWAALGCNPEHSLLVVTRADLLSAQDREKVLRRLEREAGPHFRSIAMVPQLDGLADQKPALSEALDEIRRDVRVHRCLRAAAIIRRHLQRLEAPDHQPTTALLEAASA